MRELLDYHKTILTQLTQENSLVVLAPGLGLGQILLPIIQLYNNSKHLVLLLNYEDSSLPFQLIGNSPIRSLNTLSTPQQRQELYKRGGVLMVTSRILITDILSEKLPTTSVTGLIILRGHQLRPNCPEAFIIRMIREKNENGFIYAFSDNPIALSSGFSSLEKCLKLLQIRNCMLYPRFHTEVSEEIDAKPPEVVEICVKLTKSMALIQQSILDCLEGCLSELKRCKLLLDVEDELTLDFAISKGFVRFIKGKLSTIWHRIGFRTRQTIDDLGKLRYLLEYLIHYDSVTFLKVLHIILMSSSDPNTASGWMLSDAANALTVAAQSRVYIKKKLNDKDHEIIPTLEEQPKWREIKKLIGEIELDIQHQPLESKDPVKVLILGEDPQTCRQIQNYLRDYAPDPDDTHPMLKSEYDSFWIWKESTSNLKKNISKNRPSHFTNSSAVPAKQAPASKRRRVRGSTQTTNTPVAASNQFDDLTSEVNEKKDDAPSEPQVDLDLDFNEEDLMLKDLTEEFGVLSGSPSSVELLIKPLHNISGESDLLSRIQPQYIILTVPNPSFIRQVEVYQNLYPSMNVKLFFLVYKDSVEEQNFLLQIRKEKEAFEKLIMEKANMVLPVYGSGGAEASELFINLSDQLTRVAGGQTNMKNRSIIVDMREFRSALPSALHQKGFQVVPGTLVVGDYILSPHHCVERKSIPDLVQSLASGRLYGQVEAMSQYYQHPILLIEFDETKAFSLEALGDTRSVVNEGNIKSKLVLLTLTFPKLKILWSSSNVTTAHFFDDIKKDSEDPNLETAAGIGAVRGGDEIGYRIDEVSHDILLNLPGINYANARKVMDKVKNLRELGKLSLQEMIGLLDSRVNGTKLHRFFNMNLNNLPK